MLPTHKSSIFSGIGPHSKALSLTEVLVAMTITLVFMGSITTAYIQISNASKESRLEVTSHNRARSAVDQIIRDLRLHDTDPVLGTEQFFVIESATLTFGDGVDNDGDGAIDEEILNGFDEDGDWNPGFDNHSEIAPTLFEREDFVNVPDLGDFRVDEDNRFSSDTLTFRIPANSLTGEPARLVRYAVTSFNGEENVLTRTVVSDPDGAAVRTVEPVIFEVVSLDILPMNANNDVVSPSATQRPYWQDEYDSRDYFFLAQSPIGSGPITRPYEFPSAVFIQVTVNATETPLSEIGFPANGVPPARTAKASSVVAIDAVLNNIVYNFTRPVI